MILIREFKRADIKRVLEIEEESFNDPYPKNILIDIYNLGAGFLVAQRNNIIVGYIIFWIKSENEGHIISIAVDKKHRRKGIGTKIVNTAIKILQKYNINKIKLEVRKRNKGAIKFYLNQGFKEKETLKEYYEDLEDAVIMEKDIKPP